MKVITERRQKEPRGKKTQGTEMATRDFFMQKTSDKEVTRILSPLNFDKFSQTPSKTVTHAPSFTRG